MVNPVRIIGKNFGTFVLSLLLALTVWVSAVLSADPNQNCVTPRGIPLTVVGEDDTWIRFGEIPEEVTVVLRAPRSICQELSNTLGAVTASVDLTNLGVGDHDVDVNLVIDEDFRPLQLVSVSPKAISFRLEELASQEIPLTLSITGEPAPGYNIGLTILSDSRVVISGTKTLVDQVEGAVVVLDVTNASEEINVNRSVRLLDANGDAVNGLSLSPSVIEIRQIIKRPGTFRDVTVRVVHEGQPASGYRLTNITSSPAIITVFSPNPGTIREMPGFVETTIVDITGAIDDVEQRVSLILPDGVSVVGEQSVLVQIGIAAIETSQTMSLVVEQIGLSDAYTVTFSPMTIDVILSGPLPILENLGPEDVRVILDLTELEPGVYTLVPQVVILPAGITVESILPSTIDLEIAIMPTQTPVPDGGLATPTLTPTPTRAVTPTVTPTP